jgi:hypothetical protein
MEYPLELEATPASTRRSRAASALVWCIWVAGTIAAMLYVSSYARNLPYWDDLVLVGVMSGQEPLSYRWLVMQHSEHRPILPKLILAVLLRTVPDFRAAMYLNAALLSSAAAGMIILARRIRGRTRLVDAALPMAILNLGQCECFLIGFALNLIMTACISWGLIGAFGRASDTPGWRSCLQVGGMLVLLPLCGGSGLIMMPPLVLWLAGYVACGWWTGRDIGALARSLGVGLLMTAAAIAAWYVGGYERPAYIPATPSAGAAWGVMLQVLSLAIGPNHWDPTRQDAGFALGYWKLGGMASLLLSVATIIRLAIAARGSAAERPRALGLIGVLLSLLSVAASVGLARSGLGPAMGMSSRYVTLSIPLLGVIYFAWLVYGGPRSRRLVHIGLLALVCAGTVVEARYALACGKHRRIRYARIERAIQGGMPTSRLLDLACGTLAPERAGLYVCFRMLKAARVGKFGGLVDDGLYAKLDTQDTVRR